MIALRAEVGDRQRSAADERREVMREAHMRQGIRAAQKDGFARIAVVCGAWHLGGLRAENTAKSDAALLKGLPKVKVQTTWVPWTYRHLARASGYGAGIRSPGWYEHLWRSHDSPHPRAIGWLARVARLMRERELDCSSAHLIEAARLAGHACRAEGPSCARPRGTARGDPDRADAWRRRGASLHRRCAGRWRPLRQRAARCADGAAAARCRAGAADLAPQAEALQKTLDLDLRNANDLARSHLLHRLNLLDVPWGTVARVGRSRGTFHEVWTLQWQPEFALRLIEASLWGQTVAQAATARVIDRCARAERLADLSALVDSVLLADLDSAVAAATRALEDRAAVTGDALQLLAALPPLANVFRYGNVRQTDAAMVSHVLDGLIVRASLSLPLAASSLDEAAADALRDKLLGAHAAVMLRQREDLSVQWQGALAQLADQAGAHELIQGVCTRLLLDAGSWSTERSAQALSLHLSAGAEPAKAAAWLDGFLNRNAMVLLHDAGVWKLVDDWLLSLSADHFVRVLPLVRRTFSVFAAGERRDLGQRASSGAQVAGTAPAQATWDEARAALPLPLLRRLLGIES